MPDWEHGFGVDGYCIGEAVLQLLARLLSRLGDFPSNLPEPILFAIEIKLRGSYMAKAKKSKRKNATLPARFEQINLNAAGIDIGSTQHYVAVPSDRDSQRTRCFGTFTVDLYQLADWLIECGVDTVAMESTGVYWIPLFQILETRGLEVKLVDANKVKNVSGRKSDIMDCEWLQQLHTYGLLSGAFRPDNDICVLRSYLRHRENLVQLVAKTIHHMQKALTQMNLQLHNVISDITGQTGMLIMRALLAGERDTAKLAEMKNHRIKSSAEVIAKSLQGDYRVEHLFCLRQAVEQYDFYHQQIDACDEQVRLLLASLPNKVDLKEHPLPSKRLQKARGNEPKIDPRAFLYEKSGVDLTMIPGINSISAQTILSEIGWDMSKWHSEKHFVSWLNLSPNNKITGGKIFSRKTRKGQNRAAQALRMAAYNLKNSQTALGAYYRRLCQRLDTPKAITATAAKLARIVYQMLKHGQAFVEQGIQAYEKKFIERSLKNIEKRAATLGYLLVPIVPKPALDEQAELVS
jgi:transposase